MKGKSVLVALAVTVAIAATWFVVRTREAASPDASAARLRAADTPAGSVAAQSLPQGPFDAIRPQLERRAAEGDAQAAYRLGAVIGQCRRYQSMDDTAFAQAVVGAAGLFRQLVGGNRDDDERLAVDMLLENKVRLDELCKGTDALRRDARPGYAARWLARAAELGDRRAMVDYAEVAFEEFDDAAKLMDNAAEVARRRDRARAWLQAARDAGETEAAFGFSKAYMRGDLYRRDRERSLAWWLVYAAEGGDPGRATAAAIERRLRNELDPAAQERAGRLAATLTTRRTTP